MTKAQIILWVNDKLGKTYSGTDIDDEIAAVLNDLTTNLNIVKGSDNATSVVGQHNYSDTEFGVTNIKSIIDVNIDSSDPLEEMTEREYKAKIADEAVADYDEPDSYYFDETTKTVYLYPAPDVATYTIYVNYWAVDDDVDDIELDDDFKFLVFKGVGYECLFKENEGESNKAQRYLAYYEAKKKDFSVARSNQALHYSNYRDI